MENVDFAPIKIEMDFRDVTIRCYDENDHILPIVMDLPRYMTLCPIEGLTLNLGFLGDETNPLAICNRQPGVYPNFMQRMNLIYMRRRFMPTMYYEDDVRCNLMLGFFKECSICPKSYSNPATLGIQPIVRTTIRSDMTNAQNDLLNLTDMARVPEHVMLICCLECLSNQKAFQFNFVSIIELFSHLLKDGWISLPDLCVIMEPVCPDLLITLLDYLFDDFDGTLLH